MTAPHNQCQPDTAQAALDLADEIEAQTVPVPMDLCLLKNDRALICMALRALAASHGDCGVHTANAVRELVTAADDRNHSDETIGAGFRARLEIFRPLALSSAPLAGVQTTDERISQLQYEAGMYQSLYENAVAQISASTVPSADQS